MCIVKFLSKNKKQKTPNIILVITEQLSCRERDREGEYNYVDKNETLKSNTTQNDIKFQFYFSSPSKIVITFTDDV